jgi:predicted dehydrogenase
VSSRDAARVRARLGSGVTVHADAAALIADAAIELVVIASPNATHYPLALQALAAGKHVVIDKPFASDAAEAAALTRLAAQRGLLLSVFHNRRWDSTTLSAQRLLAAGTLGPIRHASLHFDRFRPQPQARWKEDAAAGGGLWMDLAPHLLDEALLYFGMPLAIQADLATLRPHGQADDLFAARLRYADGLRVDLAASMLAAVARPRIALHGLRGSYVKQSLDLQENDLKAGAVPGTAWGLDAEAGVLAVEENGVVVTRALPTEAGAYPAYYRAVAAAMRGTGPNPVPAEQALDVMRLLDAGKRSAAERREVRLA